MSPGNRPSQPRPNPDQRRSPTAARISPLIKTIFPTSCTARNLADGIPHRKPCKAVVEGAPALSQDCRVPGRAAATALVLDGSELGARFCMCRPGKRKSSGDTDFEALMPLHPPPNRVTRPPTRRNNRFFPCQTDCCISKKHLEKQLVSLSGGLASKRWNLRLDNLDLGHCARGASG